jgi:foldase protein PrsA
MDLFKKIVKSVRKFYRKNSVLIKRISLLVICSILIMVCGLGAVGFSSYYRETDSKVINKIVEIFPYPAAMVNGRIVKLSDWKFEYQAWKTATLKNNTEVSESQLKADVLDKLIEQKLLEKIAKIYKVKVTAEDIDQEYQAIVSQYESQVTNGETFENYIKELFNWSVPEFKQRLLSQNVLAEKLTTELATNEKLWQEAEKKAQTVLAKVKNGENFEQLAQQFSEDTYSSVNGGALDWFGRGEMVTEFEDAAFALSPGEISDLVKTQFGYHIIKVEDKIAADPSQQIVESVSAKHILIRPKSLDSLMKEASDSAKVWKFIKY